jgi:hypothetical protein
VKLEPSQESSMAARANSQLKALKLALYRRRRAISLWSVEVELKSALGTMLTSPPARARHPI